jgi:hypothetical protein
LPGAPLWRLVRFRDNVEAAAATGVESALQAANLLDGWIFGGDGPLPDTESEQFLLPLPTGDRPDGPTLADVLEVEPDTGVPADRVQAVLESIAWVPDSASVSGTMVAVDGAGGYRQGVQQGSHAKGDAEYIGATARARRRAARIAELDRTIDESEAALTDARTAEAEAVALSAQVATTSRSLPRTSSVLRALKSVTENAGMLRSRTEASAAADRDLDQAIADLSAKEKQLRTAAVTHRTPHVAREIDSLAGNARTARGGTWQRGGVRRGGGHRRRESRNTGPTAGHPS